MTTVEQMENLAPRSVTKGWIQGRRWGENPEIRAVRNWESRWVAIQSRTADSGGQTYDRGLARLNWAQHHTAGGRRRWRQECRSWDCKRPKSLTQSIRKETDKGLAGTLDEGSPRGGGVWRLAVMPLKYPRHWGATARPRGPDRAEATLAQLVEHTLGKGEVVGSNPMGGCWFSVASLICPRLWPYDRWRQGQAADSNDGFGSRYRATMSGDGRLDNKCQTGRLTIHGKGEF